MDEETRLSLEKIADAPSYYPERERKSRSERIEDLSEWYQKYGEVNAYYNLWGLDLIGATSGDEYLDHGIFRKQRYEINSKFFCDGDSLPTNYTVVMRDKNLFEAFVTQTLGDSKKYVKTYAIIKGNTFFSREGEADERKQDTFEKFVARHEGETLVFKKATSYAAMGVSICKITDGKIVYKQTAYEAIEFLNMITGKAATWMIQPYLKQHEFMARLCPDAVNLIRIISFNTGARTFTTPATLCYARKGAEICNTMLGSYSAGIDSNGVIGDKALDRISYKFIPCPVAGQTLPYYKEVVDLACTLHEAIPELFSIGWDIILTENGPLVLEGNDGWGPYISEMTPETALRDLWNKTLEERRMYFDESSK